MNNSTLYHGLDWSHESIDCSSQANFECSAIQVAKQVRNWSNRNSDAFAVEVFSEGKTNRLACVRLTTASDNESAGWRLSNITTEADRPLMIRAYGMKTEAIIDRRREIDNMLCVAQEGLGATLRAILANGLAYDYMPGRLLTLDDAMKETQTLSNTIKSIAKLHSIFCDARGSTYGHQQPILWSSLRSTLAQVEAVSDSQKVAEMFNRLPYSDCSVISAEIDKTQTAIESVCESVSIPIVLCHNDLIFDNVIIHNEKDGQTVKLIDFEYGGPNYLPFEIANTFCEYVGMEGDLDYDGKFPSKEYQMAWLTEYLAHLKRFSTDNNEALEEFASHASNDVEWLYRIVQKFALAAHLTWALWALFQASHSAIDFDYVHFAGERLRQYAKTRDQILRLD